ncbi:4-chlorobenzoyl coenzyme A dehalogenase [Mycobacterium attenuatum]|nr:4-chlorobenzoyl coenzyme A dehalogenase [Mycobacterium attenuatum]
MDAVLITAVNGVTAGAGFSIAASGDIVVAAESATFTMAAYTRVGLTPDGSASYYLPRLNGMRQTQELMLTNRTLTAQHAAEWAIVTEVVPDEQIGTRSDELAELFAASATKSNAGVKKLLLSTFSNGLEEQMELEGQMIAALAASKDGREGVDAFPDKRDPNYH